MDILRDTLQTARKDYTCDACEHWLNVGYDETDVEAADWLIVQTAKADNWKILQGQKYRKVVYVEDGRIVTYRARIDMDNLVDRLDLWPDM